MIVQRINSSIKQDLQHYAWCQYHQHGVVPDHVAIALNATIINGVWHKYNPHHDTENGQFTSGPGGGGGGNGSSLTKPAAKPVPQKPKKASIFNIAHGTNANSIQIEEELRAYVMIGGRLLGQGLTTAAQDQLTKFLMGIPNPNNLMIYEVGSDGSNEIKNSSYIKKLNSDIQKSIRARNNGIIPEGLYTEEQPPGDKYKYLGVRGFDSTPPAESLEYVKPFGPNVDLADVVGSFTFPLEVKVKNDIVEYTGVNVTSLRSFSGANIIQRLGSDAKIINAPENSGPLGNLKQKIIFQFPIIK